MYVRIRNYVAIACRTAQGRVAEVNARGHMWDSTHEHVKAQWLIEKLIDVYNIHYKRRQAYCGGRTGLVYRAYWLSITHTVCAFDRGPCVLRKQSITIRWPSVAFYRLRKRLLIRRKN